MRGRPAQMGGIGGIGLIAVLLIGYFLGIDVTPLLEGGVGQPQQDGPVELTEAEQAEGEFVSVVLNDTETVWSDIFRSQLGARYDPPVLVLYSQAFPSACGTASGATGPFFCPLDKKVYLDTAFFTTMRQRLGAGGDFAAAYVVAHEVAHYVQDQVGTLGKANAARQRMSEADSNAVSVMIELQADCYSGIWARYAKERLGTLEEGDIEEAMNAASQIGDDTLQRNAGQRPMPDSFTHGTSAQRQRWFAEGYRSGSLEACDTFGADRL